MVDNPCRDQPRPRGNGQRQEENPCRPGYVRNEEGRCVPDSRPSTAVTEVPPRPENPFAIDALADFALLETYTDTAPPGVQRAAEGLRIQSGGRVEGPLAEGRAVTSVADVGSTTPLELLEGQPQQEIQYVSATRDLTTIDEGFYFNENRRTTKGFQELYPLAGAYPWSLQKEDPTGTSIDKFRMSMGNFWVFNGESESLYSPIITNPRLPSGPRADTSNDFDLQRPIEFYKEPRPGGIDRFRYIRFDGYPVPNNNRYYCYETLPFRFRKEFLDSEYIQGNYSRFPELEVFNDFTYQSLQDMYLDGSDSPGFDLVGENYFSQDNIRRSIFSSANIEYNRNFYDFVFDAPAAFLESEADKLVVSPSDIANIQVTVQNQEIFQDVESELNLPSIYSFYQSKQLEKAINNDESILENLPAGQVSFAQETITNFNELSNSNPFLDKQVHRFPSDKVAQLQEINEVMRGSVTNFVEINIKTRQGQPINSLIQETDRDWETCELVYLKRD